MRPVKSRNGNNLRAKKNDLTWRTRLVCSDLGREKAADEMKIKINLVFCVLWVLTGSSQAQGQSSAVPLVLTSTAPTSQAGTSATPDLTEDPGHDVSQQIYNLAGRTATSAETTTVSETGTVPSETATEFKTYAEHSNVSVIMNTHTGSISPSAAADNLSSTLMAQSTTSLQHVSATEGRPLLTREPLATFSSQPTHTVQDMSSTAHAPVTQPQSESMGTATTQTTGHPLTSATGRGPAGPTHWEVPSELNVGDEEIKGHRYRSSFPLDPLLAGLLSVFIVTTAIVFVVLFLKFRQRTNHPEFHRLQDLPMDDLMEDTPLSRYNY